MILIYNFKSAGMSKVEQRELTMGMGSACV